MLRTPGALDPHLALASAIVAALVLSSPAAAAVFRHGQEVVIPAGETIDDDLYIAARHVEVLGHVTGSVIAAANTVTLRGPVGGDVAAAAREVRCYGPVAGSVRAVGERVSLEGVVTRDALVAGSNVTLTGGGHVGRDLAVASRDLRVAAPVGRDAWLAGRSIVIATSVGGGVWADAEDLHLESDAAVGGDLTYASSGTLTRAPSARVSGEVKVRAPEPGEERRHGPLAAVLGWFKGLVGMFLLGLLVLLPGRGYATRALDALRRRPGASVGLGLAVAAVLPVAALVLFLLGLAIGGWWVALFLAALHLLGLLAGYVAGATRLGEALLSRARGGAPRVLALLLGLVVVGLLVQVPYVGWLAGLAAMLFGLGALTLAARPSSGPAAPAPTTA